MSPSGHPARALRLPAAVPVLLLAALPAAAGLVVMHGPAGPTSAVPWIQGGAPGPVSVRWRPESEANERSVELAAAAQPDLMLWLGDNLDLLDDRTDRSPDHSPDRWPDGADKSRGVLRWAHARKATDLRFPRARQDEP
jgi:hypothetical protein